MKNLYYNLPNGRQYRIRYTKCPNRYLGDGNYVIENLVEVEHLGGAIAKENPNGRWEFISYADTLKDARETLCLFARHPAKDVAWLNQFLVSSKEED